MKSLIIVEGRSDTRQLKTVFKDIETFETSGLGLNNDMIKFLQSIQDKVKLIVFTDPDAPGEIIRNRLIKNIEMLHHAYLPNDKALSKNKKKIGIEHASAEDIKTALNNLYIKTKSDQNYDLEDLINLGIYNDKEKRVAFCDFLHISFGNNKKVLKQLNYYGIKKEKIKEFIEEENGSS